MNDQMQHARDVALGILKPSQRDIEHGLELHEHALVIESYGLGLRSPIDPDPVNAAIEAGASDRELQDLTEDMGMTRWALTPELRREYREIWRASGVTCTFQNAGEECNDPLRLIKRLARHTYNTDAIPDFLQRVTTPDDIAAAPQSGQTLHLSHLQRHSTRWRPDQPGRRTALHPRLCTTRRAHDAPHVQPPEPHRRRLRRTQ